jgi:pyruvate,orthophosphate dikinase
MVCDLMLLRVVGLKGVADEAMIASALRDADFGQRIAAALEKQQLRQITRGYALTPQGRTDVQVGLSAEQESIDASRISAIYERFCTINARFKSLMHAWQLRTVDNAEVPNDHLDAEYDGTIIAELGEIDSLLQPLLQEIMAIAPRLELYPIRLADALCALREGDSAMMARPMIDSYHTVWFELHEDLISLVGTTRAEEAAAGRGD